MRDSHYTSDELAEIMVNSLPREFIPIQIADFAAGEGSLIEAALRKWPDAAVFCNDVSKPCRKVLQVAFPQAETTASDFLKPRLHSSPKFSRLRQKVDLILLNPPFSLSLFGRVPVRINGREYRVGVAAAFIYKALKYISSNGYLIAVVPDSILSSKRDAPVIDVVNSGFELTCIRRNGAKSFVGVSANTSIVRISRLMGKKCQSGISAEMTCVRDFQILRGWCQMHRLAVYISNRGLPLVHTSNIVNGIVDFGGPRVSHPRYLTGPAILFPRVGKISQGKVAILPGSRTVVLSDCVLAVQCASESEAEFFREQITSHWDQFVAIYRGTGAPYTTITRALDYFRQYIQDNVRQKTHFHKQ